MVYFQLNLNCLILIKDDRRNNFVLPIRNAVFKAVVPHISFDLMQKFIFVTVKNNLSAKEAFQWIFFNDSEIFNEPSSRLGPCARQALLEAQLA